jgi:hypothetical protein
MPNILIFLNNAVVPYKLDGREYPLYTLFLQICDLSFDLVAPFRGVLCKLRDNFTATIANSSVFTI